MISQKPFNFSVAITAPTISTDQSILFSNSVESFNISSKKRELHLIMRSFTDAPTNFAGLLNQPNLQLKLVFYDIYGNTVKIFTFRFKDYWFRSRVRDHYFACSYTYEKDSVQRENFIIPFSDYSCSLVLNNKGC